MESIYSRLRAWRFALARELNVPSFFILSNSHLAGVAAACPATLDEVAACPGVGPKKLVQFGQALIDEVARCLAEGLEPGVEVPAPAPEAAPGAPLSDDDLCDIAVGLRKELAVRLARRFRGRFTPAQVEEALRRLALPA